ncbi:MAG: oxygen-independent coproporphyrinogen III oxidase [Candidatus Krumholzibacteriia bacterium]
MAHGTHGMSVDLELLQKYDRPGPRYTSYPTAPHFSGALGPDQYREEIVASNRGGDLPGLSLYFHFPFCQSLCYFCGCNMTITHDRNQISDYLSHLRKEIDLVAGLMGADRRVVQMHWGGGTPTFLTPVQIQETVAHIRKRFHFAGDAEVSIEIDPRRLEDDHLPVIREVGFNRVSYGVQDFDDKVQETINRIQPEALTRAVVEKSRELEFDSVNVDLIYGLPYQTLRSYESTVDKIVDISPDRLAVFNYAHVPWLKKHQRVFAERSLPDASDRLRILKMVIDRLTGAGYVYIGMDHFAKPGDELSAALEDHSLHRNFQGYSTHAELEIYAMGVSSISQLRNVYAQNRKTIKEYKTEISNGNLPIFAGCRLDDDDQLRRYVITELMCNSRVVKSHVEGRYGVDFDDYFADSLARLDKFVDDGLVSRLPDRLQVHENGRLVIRNIAMEFDRYLQEGSDGGQQIYSRTV